MTEIAKKNLLSLHTVDVSDISAGFVILIHYHTELIPIAEIFWSDDEKCSFIKTVRDNFQTYIIDWERFISFIYLVDVAYDKLEEVNKGKQ